MPFFFYDPTMILLIPAIILTLYASAKVKTTYNKYKRIRSRGGLTGKDAAKLILHYNGIRDVEIEMYDGFLTDHYDPKSKILRLSRANYEGRSLAAVGVAAHEAGHAIQHAKGYAPLGIRSAIVPISGFGSYLAFPLIIIGMIFANPMFLDLGILLFSAFVFFTLITLPVEFNASARAIAEIEGSAILDKEEIPGAKKVLNAAALTYVAAAAVAIIQLIRLLLFRSFFSE